MKKFYDDPRIDLTDIWVNFNVGEIRTTDSGAHIYRPFVVKRSRITSAVEVELEKCRKELHRQLDEMIDSSSAIISKRENLGVKI